MESDGLAEASTEHLLLGLFSDGVAAATLEQLGVTRDKIRETNMRFSAEAQFALAGAERLTLNTPRPAFRSSPPQPSCSRSSPSTSAPAAAAS